MSAVDRAPQTIDITSVPPITRAEAQVLATTEYGRMVDQLRSLGANDWAEPTDCPLWDVRALAGHSVGMLSDFRSFRPLMRRMRAATKASKRSGEVFVDVMTAMQVDDNAALTTDELIARAAANAPRAAGWRTKSHGLFRHMPMKEVIGGQPETWRMGYVLKVILTRDPWMHRVDIARATGRDLVLTADHDGRIIADVVAEWARRHGQPVTLTLAGPAGGRYVSADGSQGEELSLDAVEFCRILSGRADGAGLLAQPVPF
jgi:uncharacterized protein (TIGR03083 family)